MLLGMYECADLADCCESHNEHGWHNCWTFSQQSVSIMKNKININILAPLIIGLSLTLNSCEPPLCAHCHVRGNLLRLSDNKDIEICADDAYELEELVWLSEEMGYKCEYKQKKAKYCQAGWV